MVSLRHGIKIWPLSPLLASDLRINFMLPLSPALFLKVSDLGHRGCLSVSDVSLNSRSQLESSLPLKHLPPSVVLARKGKHSGEGLLLESLPPDLMGFRGTMKGRREPLYLLQ